MRFSEFMRKLNPLGNKSSFQKVTTDGEDDAQVELEDAYTFSFAPKTIQLRLIDSSEEEDDYPGLVSANKKSAGRSGSGSGSVGWTLNSSDNSSSEASSFKMMAFRNNKGPPEEDLNLETRNHVYHPTTVSNEHDDNHPETQLLDSDPRPAPRPRRCRFGVRTCLILAMVAFVLTIFVAVIGVFVADSLAMGAGHGGSDMHNASQMQSLHFDQHGRIPDVNDEDEQDTTVLINKEILKIDWQYTTTDPTATAVHHTDALVPQKLQKKHVPEKLIRESYKQALKDFSTSGGNDSAPIDFKSLPLLADPQVKQKLLLQQGHVMELAYRNIVKVMNLTVGESNKGAILLENGTLPEDLCPPLEQEMDCNQTEMYRSLDGTCNHFNKPFWGASSQPYRRMLFPHYEDGISSPRSESHQVPHQPLPSARLVSDKVHIDEFRTHTKLSMMMPLWAHFIFHDMVYTSSVLNSSKCCQEGRIVSEAVECLPIHVPRDDVFFGEQKNLSCLDYQRAPPYGSCRFGPREQFNKATAFIDASHIYGVTPEILNSLRSFDRKRKGQMLLVNTGDEVSLLPGANVNSSSPLCLKTQEENQASICFRSGDERVNNVLTITALQTIWVRHHNSIAGTLSNQNAHWDEEKVFQEARRIVIAQIQHITFNEFLPRLLSKEQRNQSGLILRDVGYYQEFDGENNPGISNGFTVAFQFFQSMIQGLQIKLDMHRTNEEFIQFHKLTSSPEPLFRETELEKFMLGASYQHSSKIDAFVSGQITNHMYQKPNRTYGLDMISLIIQEGRDHGVPAYVEWRKKCTETDTDSFDDLKEIWDPSALQRVKEVFLSVKDVDLFTGILSELPSPKSELGPTLVCIVADQFARLRKGDMFWYEGDIRNSHFSAAQLQAIKKTSLARILCESGLEIRKIQKSVMLVPNNDNNRVVHCHEIDKVRYGAWREKHVPRRHHHGEDYDDGLDSVEENYDHYLYKTTPLATAAPTRQSRTIEILTNAPAIKTNAKREAGKGGRGGGDGGGGRVEKNKLPNNL